VKRCAGIAILMGRCALVCVLLSLLAWGQAASSPSAQSGSSSPSSTAQPKPGETPSPQPSTVVPGGPLPSTVTPSAEPGKPPDVSVVPLDAPVITIEGVCDKTAAAGGPPAECKTVVTRAEFEKFIGTVQPNLPLAQQRQAANSYATALILSHEGERLGLDKDPEYDERMKLARLEVLMQMMVKNARAKANDISDKDVADYYQAHAAQYEQASAQQLFIPLTKTAKLPGATPPKTQTDGTEAMKKEAETLRGRAAAGEDFAKLEAEAYQFAGLKTTPPDTHISNLRRASLSPARTVVMELKPGEVSQVIADPTGYFVYKIEKKESAPLEQVRSEISSQLKAQRTQAALQSLQHLGTPKLEDRYFGPAPKAPGTPLVPSGARAPSAPKADTNSAPPSKSAAPQKPVEVTPVPAGPK